MKLCLCLLLLCTGCRVHPPDSPPGLPFVRTPTTERQRAWQEWHKWNQDKPSHSGIVFRDSQ